MLQSRSETEAALYKLAASRASGVKTFERRCDTSAVQNATQYHVGISQRMKRRLVKLEVLSNRLHNLTPAHLSFELPISGSRANRKIDMFRELRSAATHCPLGMRARLRPTRSLKSSFQSRQKYPQSQAGTCIE